MVGLADRTRAEIEEGQFMADRAERCPPNNPANGGHGYDTGDGRWVDRRGPEWVSVEDHFAGTDVLERVDGVTDDVPQEPGWFARRRVLHELGTAFGDLDVYEAEIKGSGGEADDPGWRAAIIDRIDRLVATAPPRALDEYIGLFDDIDPKAATNADYVEAWEDIKAEMAEEELQAQLDEIDPLTRDDVNAAAQELGNNGSQGLTSADLSEFEQVPYEAEPEPGQYLGYVNGELVRDTRTGITGRVHVRDDEETGRYAEVQWDDSFVADQLEVALDNGLDQDGALLEAVVADGIEADGDPGTTATPAVTSELGLDDAELLLIEPKTAGPEPATSELPAPEDQVVLDVAEPELVADEPGVDEPQPDGAELATENALEAELDTPVVLDESEWPTPIDWEYIDGELVRASEPVLIPEPPSSEKDQLTKDWVKELRSGRHKQTHGHWEEPGVFGGVRECTMQVAVNSFGIPLGELADKYGNRFVGEILRRNDTQRQTFNEIADFIERTQLQGRDREMELER